MQLVMEKDPILSTKVEDFDFSSDFDLQTLTDEMFTFLEVNGGIGLAAPQIGAPIRLFIMNLNGIRHICINPSYKPLSGDTVLDTEGCLSFPNLLVSVTRYTDIDAHFENEKGDEIFVDFIGLASRCFQHELDHLDGIVFTDRVSKLKRDMAERKRAKLLKKRSK